VRKKYKKIKIKNLHLNRVGLKKFRRFNMKRVDRAVIKIINNRVNVELYQKEDWSYNDELEFFKIAEIKEESNFAIGCFEVEVFVSVSIDEIKRLEEMIKEAKKELEGLESSKWNESEAIMYKKEYIEYLEEEKRKREEAESVNVIVIDYSMGTLRINYNEKSIEIKDDKELLFKNLEIKIEKY
jgi:hypothetical protein